MDGVPSVSHRPAVLRDGITAERRPVRPHNFLPSQHTSRLPRHQSTAHSARMVGRCDGGRACRGDEDVVFLGGGTMYLIGSRPFGPGLERLPGRWPLAQDSRRIAGRRAAGISPRRCRGRWQRGPLGQLLQNSNRRRRSEPDAAGWVRARRGFGRGPENRSWRSRRM